MARFSLRRAPPPEPVLAAVPTPIVAVPEAPPPPAVDNEMLDMRLRLHGRLIEEIDQGMAITEVAQLEPRPLVVEMISTNIATLQSIGSQLRQAEARALRAEGATMEWIADLFGDLTQKDQKDLMRLLAKTKLSARRATMGEDQ